ncbi:MAG: hypothetical protein SFW67_32595 [Myxococcaceae bacterium]|nr:hypothetical protein [Myxococcaceae bacterium]
MRTPSILRLKWSVQALAQDAATQVTLFPRFVSVPDELVLEFDEHLRAAPRSGLSPDAALALDALAQVIDRHSGEGSAPAWTPEGLQTHEAWRAIRTAALRVLATAGWGTEAPPANRGDVFVGADE